MWQLKYFVKIANGMKWHVIQVNYDFFVRIWTVLCLTSNCNRKKMSTVTFRLIVSYCNNTFPPGLIVFYQNR